MSFKTVWCLLFLCFSLIYACPAFANKGATVLSVAPAVYAILDGKSSELVQKMLVPVSATVKSDAAGRAQLMFADTTTISIAPATEIALAEFVDNPNEESIIINMAIGTARFITGETSRRNHSALKVTTPHATVGIRGTMVTVKVTGDTTYVYLTETSGKGVDVTNRNTGETINIFKPGNMIIVGPKEIKERGGRLDEVRQMTIDLHTAPRLSDDERTVPIGVVNVTPKGNFGPGGGFDVAQNQLEMMPMPVMPTPPGLDISLINGHFIGTGVGQVDFDVNAYATISNVFAVTGQNDFIYADSGTIKPGGAFSVNNFVIVGPTSQPINASMTGQFDSPTDGSWNISGNNNQGQALSGGGTFSKQ